MSCPACGHDCCDGSCPPNAPLEFEYCAICGNREEYDDLEDDICGDCINKGYTRETTECEICGLFLRQGLFERHAEPFKRVEVRGLTRTMCPTCAEKEVAA